MLVILSGADTIGKRLLSRQIVVTMNQFIVDGFRVDFSKRPYEIYSESNELVLTAAGPTTWVDQYLSPPSQFIPQQETTLMDSPPTEDPNYYENYGDNTPVTGTENVPVTEKESINPIIPPTVIVPQDTQNKIKQLSQQILDDEINNSFMNIFQDVEYDYGLTDTLEFNARWGSDLARNVNYQTIIDNYNNKAYDTLVITGTFSKGIIDKLQADLGADNVVTLNISRNPSVAFMLNKKSDQWYQDNNRYTYSWDVMKLEGSLFNCINLKRFSNINTIKFEDMLELGYFNIGDVIIPLPAEFVKYNQYLTVYEKSIIDLNYETETALNNFNVKITNHLQPTITDFNERVTEREKAFNKKITYVDYQHWPNNFFTELGYTSLTTRTAIIS
jgi:hypothetical protein